jgi:hypothetical protein|tara:strand:+ start:511 stop:915 length:405 start_codon:yes stop_codon:yes gene_type:complete
MPTVTLSFDHEINTSVQVGDKAYYVHTFPVGTANVWAQTTTPHDSADREDIREIGVIETINSSMTLSIITVEMPNNLSALYGPPVNGDFIMFSKDNKVNLSSLVGYYSTAKLRNSSRKLAELFSVNCDFSESSK